jgi:hypothetical protein
MSKGQKRFPTHPLHYPDALTGRFVGQARRMQATLDGFGYMNIKPSDSKIKSYLFNIHNTSEPIDYPAVVRVVSTSLGGATCQFVCGDSTASHDAILAR